MPRPWPEKSRRMVASTRVFDVITAERVSPRTARSHEFAVIACPDWVNVVALTTADELVLVEQWRHGTESVTVEVPGGMVDPGETPHQAAQRELREETGYGCSELLWIGTVEPNPAIQSNRCHTFLALGCVAVAQPHFDSTEECALRLEPATDAARLVVDGVITHALTVAAFGHAWMRGHLPLAVAGRRAGAPAAGGR